jgi:hypothetical protein
MCLQQREDERGHLVGELRIRLAPEGRDLGTLDRVEQTELRLDDAGLRLIAAELQADCAMQLNQIRDAEVARAAAVSR